MRRFVIGILVSSAALAGCGDHDVVTQPSPPLDVAGTWHGGVTSSQVSTPCATPEPASVTATFIDTDGHVTGTFTGACLDGATFEGRVQNQRLLGDTTLHGHYCAIPAATDGRGSTNQLALDVRVHQRTEFFPCSEGIPATGLLRLDLSR